MAWRPTDYVLDGELDNTALGKVTGWIRFAGLEDEVHFELEGNFHRDIRGAKIRIRGSDPADDGKARRYMEGFATLQYGKVGDITTGVAPSDYMVGAPYIEWYSDQNGRVVLEFEPEQVQVIGTPIPACESDPVSREEQARNMADFLADLNRELQVPAIAVGSNTPLGIETEACAQATAVVRGRNLLGQVVLRIVPDERSCASVWMNRVTT